MKKYDQWQAGYKAGKKDNLELLKECLFAAEKAKKNSTSLYTIGRLSRLITNLEETINNQSII